MTGRVDILLRIFEKNVKKVKILVTVTKKVNVKVERVQIN